MSEHKVIDQIYQAMMSRLVDLTDKGYIDEGWVDTIGQYDLGYEVAHSSGLTLSIIENCDNDEFLCSVSHGIFAWDI
jgi:hypothetical protein